MEHTSSPPVFRGVRVILSLVLCVCFVDRFLSFYTFSFGHCVVCSSSIYRVWLGTDHLTWRGGYGFLLRSEFFFRSTRELEFIFFCRAKREFCFQSSTLGYMTKTLNQIIIFFLHQNQNIFFSNIGNQNIFLEKNHNPPFKLIGRSLTPLVSSNFSYNFIFW